MNFLVHSLITLSGYVSEKLTVIKTSRFQKPDMATIKNKLSEQTIVLHSFHTFGRSSESDTEINEKTASMLHAAIRWMGSQWMLLDYSRNGVRLNSTFLKNGDQHSLNIGDQISFVNKDNAAFEITDISAPQPLMVGLTPHSPDLPLFNVHGLPNNDKPIATLTYSTDGMCHYETEEESRLLADKDIIEVDDYKWQYYSPDAVAQTNAVQIIKPIANARVKAAFQVSQNEEHVALILTIDDEEKDLGERVHHYLLLLLARQRLDDIHDGKPEKMQGWIKLDSLPGIIGVSESHLNILIFRARKQIAETLNQGDAGTFLLQRKLGNIRVKFSDIDINKDSVD